MGKVKKNFWLIFLVLLLGVNNVLAGERFYALTIFPAVADTPYTIFSLGDQVSFMNNFRLINGGIVQKIQFNSNQFYLIVLDWQVNDVLSYVNNGKVHLILYDYTANAPLLDFGLVDWQGFWGGWNVIRYWYSQGNISGDDWYGSSLAYSIITLPSNHFDVPNVFFPSNHTLIFALKNFSNDTYFFFSPAFGFPQGITAYTWDGNLSVFIKFIGQLVYGLDLIKPPFGNQNYYWDTNDASNNFIIADIYSDNVYNNLNDIDIAIYDYQTNQLIWGFNKFIGLTLAQNRITFDFSSENLNDIIRNATSTSIFKLVFTAHLYNNTLTEKIDLTDFSIFYRLSLPVIKFFYSDWYNSIIGNFGLSGATPTPIFVKAGQTLDNIFQTFQTFITIDNEKLNNLKASIIDNLNTFISYINGFTDALGFLKYLFYGLLVFTMIEFIVKFGRLIIPFK
jgi:hypothetical protein